MPTNQNKYPPAFPADECRVPIDLSKPQISAHAVTRRRKPASGDGLSEAQRDLLLDVTQIVLDLVGVVEPTPFADAANAAISFKRGDHFGGWISVVSVVPYLGDLAKLGKFPSYIATVKRVSDQFRKSSKFAKSVEPILRQLSDVLDILEKLKGRLGEASKTLNDSIKRMIAKPVRAIKAGSKAGMLTPHYLAVLKIAQQRGLIIAFRNANEACLTYIARGFPSKPVEISAKTQADGLVRALTGKEIEQALNSGFMVVGKGGDTVMVKNSSGEVITQAIPDGVQGLPNYKPRSGHIIHKNAELPLTGDYDLLAIIDPKDLNKNATGTVLGGKGNKSITNPYDSEVIADLNKEMKGHRVLHGTHEHFGSLVNSGDVTLFMPDGLTTISLKNGSDELRYFVKLMSMAAKSQN